MSKKRDYKAEYARRVANAEKRGLSRSQARGHAKAGEAAVSKKPIASDEKLEAALKSLRVTGNQSRAAKEAGVSAERFRAFLRSNDLATRQGNTWRITDNRTRHMTVITDGEAITCTFNNFDQASLNGKHLAAFDAFKKTNDIDFLSPFEGKSVLDANGKSHLLETDPNALYRLANAGSEVFHEIYRLTT